MSKRILVVEDEDAIRGFILLNLQKCGYSILDADCGERALEIFKENSAGIDIVLLDVMMPGIDGYETCKRIREISSDVGVIMLTAKAQEADKIMGLSSGADDYVTKPFSPTELVARIEALYRRIKVTAKKKNEPYAFQSGDFILNLKKRNLTKNGEVIDLTGTEYQIMECLISKGEFPVSRKAIGERVWGEGYINEEKIVDVNIRRLRMKLEEDPSEPKYIQTVWGRGYVWAMPTKTLFKED
jgi:DNA-binding response OmpR family regulator